MSLWISLYQSVCQSLYLALGVLKGTGWIKLKAMSWTECIVASLCSRASGDAIFVCWDLRCATTKWRSLRLSKRLSPLWLFSSEASHWIPQKGSCLKTSKHNRDRSCFLACGSSTARAYNQRRWFGLSEAKVCSAETYTTCFVLKMLLLEICSNP